MGKSGGAGRLTAVFRFAMVKSMDASDSDGRTKGDPEISDFRAGERVLHQPHDKLFAAAFGVPENTAALLRAKLPPVLAAAIDWETMKAESGSFVDPGFARAHADLLFSAKVHGRPALIYVLFEHQSTRDPRLALRLLGYMVRIWARLEPKYPHPRRLPPILPVVLAQNAADWDLPERFSELLDLPEELEEGIRPHLPDFLFHHLQLSGMDYETIPGTSSGIFVLRTMKAERLGELLGDAVWDEALIAEIPADLLEMVLRYILGGEIDRRAFEARVRKIENPEIRSKAMTLVQVYRQEGRQEGRQEDILEALELRFGDLPEGLAEAVCSVRDEAKLRVLYRAAIQSDSLDEFSGLAFRRD